MRVSLLDVDGVGCNFVDPCIDILNVMLGTSHTSAQLRTGDLFDDLGIHGTLKAAVYDECGRPGWCRALPVMDGFREGVEMLRRMSTVVFVTSPLRTLRDGHDQIYPTWCAERLAWLSEHVGATRNDVIFTSAKEHVAGDLLVDDHTGHCTRWKRRHLDGLALRWASPNNAGENYDGDTVSSWEDVCTMLRLWTSSHTSVTLRRWRIS